ncbi:MAG: hypothetical protein U1E86_28670 [Burkholderiaceae bacterium]
MYVDREDVFYYLTVANEPYVQAEMPEGCAEGILRGLYKVRAATEPGRRTAAALLRQRLDPVRGAARPGVACGVRRGWSAERRRAGTSSPRRRRRRALEHAAPARDPRVPYFRQALDAEPWPIVAASDYMKTLPLTLATWAPDGLHALGTDGFGRSETRESLRRFFEVDAEPICVAALERVSPGARRSSCAACRTRSRSFGLDPGKPDPTTV